MMLLCMRIKYEKNEYKYNKIIMHTYNFITPSDPITFKTDDDKVAMAACLIIGQGQAGALRLDEVSGIEIKIPSLTIFDKDASKTIENYLGIDLGKYLEQNEPKIAECLASFAYTTMEDRAKFDKEFSKITDPKKKNEFLIKHDKKKRTSVSQWCNTAWSYARAINNKIAMEAISKN